VTYTLKIKSLAEGAKLYAYYDNALHELTYDNEGGGKAKLTLSVGDPPIGAG
jgi:hypothetical protein